MKAATGFAALAGLACSAGVLGQTCPLVPLNPPSTDAIVSSHVLFDDQNSGVPRLYISGVVTRRGVVQSGSVFRWTGVDWDAVQGAPAGRPTLVVQRESGRDILYGYSTDGYYGAFSRFDGTAWTALPSIPLNGAYVGSAVSFDPDGDGPEPACLYALVDQYDDLLHVTHEHGRVYQFTGSQWVELGSGTGTGQLVVFQPGAGPDAGHPQLYLSGVDTWCTEDLWGGMWHCTSTARVQQLVGSQWTTILAQAPRIQCLHDPDGAGPLPPLLCVTGEFVTAEGAPTEVGVWDGAVWSGIAPGLSDIRALVSYDPDGSGPAAAKLVAGGSFQRSSGAPADGIAIWEGAQWAPFAGSVTPAPERPLWGVNLWAVADHGSGAAPTLHVEAYSDLVEGQVPGWTVTWRGGSWNGLLDGPAGPVRSLTTFNDGTGAALFASGTFRGCGPLVANNIARWGGQHWSALGTGIEPTVSQPNPEVFASVVHNDGSGAKLYVAGTFASAGGVPLRNIARWTGAAWERVGSYGLSGGYVYALTTHDPDGAGPLPARLYAGGTFTFADNTPVTHLASWDGSAWLAVPGLAQPSGNAVRALRSWDDGSGPTLWVGGDPMTAGALPANAAFRLTGAGWEPLPTLLYQGGERVNAFAFHDLGGGVHAYALGIHSYGLSARLVNGAWYSGPYPPSYLEHEAFVGRSADDGRGAAFFVGDLRYTGPTTSTINYQPSGSVRAMTQVYDDGNGPALFYGGDFIALSDGVGGGAAVAHIARLPVCSACYPNCDNSSAPPVLNVSDFSCFLTRFASADPWANCDASTAPPTLNVLDFTCFLQRFAAGCP